MILSLMPPLFSLPREYAHACYCRAIAGKMFDAHILLLRYALLRVECCHADIAGACLAAAPVAMLRRYAIWRYVTPGALHMPRCLRQLCCRAIYFSSGENISRMIDTRLTPRDAPRVDAITLDITPYCHATMLIAIAIFCAAR